MALNSSKLQRHARKFHECKRPAVVLKRYFAKAPEISHNELQQYMCHVCAWIALAQPPDEAATRIGDMALSPVRVLVSLLRLRGNAHLADRLRAALRAVKACGDVVLEASAGQGVGADLKMYWQELRHCMPILRKRKRLQVAQADVTNQSNQAGDIEDANDVTMFQRLRRLRDVSESQALVADAKRCLLDIGGRLEPCRRQVLYDIIGALSPPNVLPTARNIPEPIYTESQERLMQTASLQNSVRKILLKAITTWRCDLMLEDYQIEPILQHIRNYIQQFENAHGSLQHAGAANQWQALHSAIGTTATLQPFADVAVKESRRGLLLEDGSATKPSKLSCGVWEPSDRVKALATCMHLPAESTKL